MPKESGKRRLVRHPLPLRHRAPVPWLATHRKVARNCPAIDSWMLVPDNLLLARTVTEMCLSQGEHNAVVRHHRRARCSMARPVILAVIPAVASLNKVIAELAESMTCKAVER